MGSSELGPDPFERIPVASIPSIRDILYPRIRVRRPTPPCIRIPSGHRNRGCAEVRRSLVHSARDHILEQNGPAVSPARHSGAPQGTSSGPDQH